MKIWCYILSLCLLSLSSLACPNAEAASSIPVQEELSDADQSPDPCEHASGEEDCSSFCSCQCCHIHGLLGELTLPSFPRTFAGQEDCFIPSQYANTFQAVWHPPKA